MGYNYYEMVTAVGYDSSQLIVQVEVQVRYHSEQMDNSKPAIVDSNMAPQLSDDGIDTAFFL